MASARRCHRRLTLHIPPGRIDQITMPGAVAACRAIEILALAARSGLQSAMPSCAETRRRSGYAFSVEDGF